MSLRWQQDVPLAPLTTLGVGGPARWYVACRDEEDVRLALARCNDQGWNLLVLGGGSNLLVSDRGFDGLVLRLLDDAVHADVDASSVRVRVGAGHDWDRLVSRCVDEGWAGIECLSGIPGRVGAAPLQNIGAYGQELRETLHEVRAVRRRDGEIVHLPRESCGFGYRTSVFKRGEVEPMVITGVTLELRARGEAAMRYDELRDEIAAQLGEGPPTLAQVRAAVLAVRRRKSMVLDARDPNARSAGSFFLNPTVDEATAQRVRARVMAAGHTATMPAYDAGSGRLKLSAAWLIERAGFARGTRRGRAGLSEHHVLALVNRGGATAAELLALAIEVRERVARELGVRLVPEPNLVGFDAEEIAPLRDSDS